MNKINREQFEAWLFSQPDERQLNYVQGQSYKYPGCLVCNFLREIVGLTCFYVSSNDIGWWSPEINNSQKFQFEDWLYSLLEEIVAYPESEFTIKQAKNSYLLLFPNAIVGNNDSPAIADASLNSIAKVTESNLTQS